MLAEARCSQRTLDGYLAVLAKVFVLQFVPAWSTNLSGKVIRRAKLVMVDSGLASHLTGLTADRIDDPMSPFGQIPRRFRGHGAPQTDQLERPPRHALALS